ncbi:MAG: hypothetical protein IJV83_00940 [Clostridia bacterium]|nr:hypothetical protein [Clostridia bacterium]
MKKITAYEIALSGLACAFSTIILVLGVYVDAFLFTGYLLASIALMLPLAKRSWWGYILAYIATSVLSLVFAAGLFWNIIPFIIFYGLHPLVNELQLRTRVNRWVACGIKAAWFDITLWIIWKFVVMMTGVSYFDKYIIPIILVVGTAFFVAYDYAMYKCRYKINCLVDRITRK